jgi:prepilin-type processing-associated H-X9-DG protein
MNWIKTLLIAALAGLLAAVAVHFIDQGEVDRLRRENQNLQAQQATLSEERDAASAALAAKTKETQQGQREQTELLRLRSEVGMLRAQTNQVAVLRDQNRKLQAALSAPGRGAAPTETTAETDPERAATVAKMNTAKQLMLGIHMYAADNANQLPASFEQMSPYFPSPIDTNQFEVVIQGSLNAITNAAETIALRERQPVLLNGVRMKTYGFADGHVEYKKEPPEGFDAWEAQHLMRPPAP